MKTPRLSLGMPVYNSDPALFQPALRDILAQTFGDFEVILADNASDEPSREMYEAAARSDTRIRYVRHPTNLGAINNFDFVAREARAQLFAWVADDDLRAPTFVERGVEVLDSRPELIGVQYESALIDRDGRRRGTAVLNSKSARKPTPFARLGVLAAANYNFVTYGLHRTKVIQALNLKVATTFWDTVQTIDLMLRGPVETIDGDLFSYRINYRPENDVFRTAQQFGTVGSLGDNKYSNVAFLCLAHTLTSSAALSPAERAACTARILAWVTWRGYFTQDEFIRTIPELRSSLEHRDLARAMILGAKVLALSPTYPVRRWRTRRDPDSLA